MIKVKAILLSFCLALFGCSNESLKALDDIQLLESAPSKLNAPNIEVTNIIPKGEVLRINSKRYMKDFLVLEVSYDNAEGFVIFDGRKMQIIEN